MNRFWQGVIAPLLEAAEPRAVIEIGSWGGANTANLLELCRRHGATLHVVDPAPQFEVAGMELENEDVLVFHRALSLEALPDIGPSDAVLIDGDHNWHTVYHELVALDERAASCERPFPLVLLHDLTWPYGRRDLYYNPDTVPREGRQPYARAGMLPGRSDLMPRGGLNRHLLNADHEGGPRNGVRTAVEDFLRDVRADIRLVEVPGLHTLGVLHTEQHAAEPRLGPAIAALGTEGFLRSHCESVEEHRVSVLVELEEAKDGLKRARVELKQALRREKRLRGDARKAATELQALGSGLDSRARGGLLGPLREALSASGRRRSARASVSAALSRLEPASGDRTTDRP